VRDGEETKGTEGSGGALVRSLLRISGAVLLAVGFLLYPFFYFMQERLIFVRQGITPEEREGVRRSFPHETRRRYRPFFRRRRNTPHSGIRWCS
jgi:hypothetical protein